MSKLATIDHDGLNTWLEQPGNHYLGFGGAGDALLLLASCYDDPTARVTFFSNELEFAPKFFEVFNVPVFIHRNIRPCPALREVSKRITGMPNFRTSAHLADNLDCHDWQRNPAKYHQRIKTETNWPELLGVETIYGSAKPLAIIAPCGSQRNRAHRRYLTVPEYRQLILSYQRNGFAVMVCGTHDERKHYGVMEWTYWTTCDSTWGLRLLREVNGAAEVFSVDSWLKTYSLLAGVKTKVLTARDETNAGKGFGASCSDFIFLDPHLWPELRLLRKLPVAN